MEISQKSIAGQSLRCLEINPTAQKTLVILHGWGSNIDSWKNFITCLDKQFSDSKAESLHILAFDLPGFGNSLAPKTAWQLKNYSELVYNFLISFKIEKINLLGHSFGGQIATKFTYEHPEKLEQLFLIGAAAIRPKRNFFRVLINFFAKVLKIILLGKGKKLRHFLYKIIGGLDYENLVDPIMKQTMRNVIADDLQNILTNITVPTTIIWGKGDTYTPLWQGKLINKLIPNSKMIVLDDARHGIHLQHPEKLSTIVFNELNNHA